jgi:hypothetical protein
VVAGEPFLTSRRQLAAPLDHPARPLRADLHATANRRPARARAVGEAVKPSFGWATGHGPSLVGGTGGEVATTGFGPIATSPRTTPSRIGAAVLRTPGQPRGLST